MSGEPRRCQGTTNEGEPCRSGVVGESGFCLRHDPDPAKQALARASSIRGGITTRSKSRRGIDADELPPLDSPQAAEIWCEVIGRAVATGRVSASQAQATMRSVSEWRSAFDAGALADRVARLQEQLAELKGGRKVHAV